MRKVIPHRRALTLQAAKGLCPFGIPESSNPVPGAQGVMEIKRWDCVCTVLESGGKVRHSFNSFLFVKRHHRWNTHRRIRPGFTSGLALLSLSELPVCLFLLYNLMLERCPSGSWCRSRKAVCAQAQRGFESHPLRHGVVRAITCWAFGRGEVLEWPIRRAWRARVASCYRGFESHPLRQPMELF